MLWKYKLVQETDIQRRESQGFGYGFNWEYGPWLRKHDVPSKGLAREIPGIKILRPHHVLSNWEYWVFLILEWLLQVVDIREQFPLFDRILLADLCRRNRFRIPTYRGTSVIYVLSTDFLVTLRGPEGPFLLAISVKPFEALGRKRVRELLTVERLYWKEKGVRWGLITNRQIPFQLPRNIRWLRQGAVLPNELKSPGLHQSFLGELSAFPYESFELRNVLYAVARRLEIPYETAVALFKFHGWHHTIQADMDQPINLCRPLSWLKVHSIEESNRWRKEAAVEEKGEGLLCLRQWFKEHPFGNIPIEQSGTSQNHEALV